MKDAMITHSMFTTVHSQNALKLFEINLVHHKTQDLIETSTTEFYNTV